MSIARLHDGGPNGVRPQPVRPGSLRPGQRVRVRSAAAILATLDDAGSIDGVPFMPEMLEYLGRTFTVYKRLEKLCDYRGEPRSRRMRDTVLLENMRCDGSGHGGCDLECRVFWKEAWLEEAVGEPSVGPDDTEAREALMRVATRHSHPAGTTSENVYRCQGTTQIEATTPLREKGPMQYLREVRVGNVSPALLVRVATGVLLTKLKRLLGKVESLPNAGDDRVDGDKLGLVPGEWVEVRSIEEIGATLNASSAHRGLVFSPAMALTCGQRFRVSKRVERMIDARSGELRVLKNDCIALEGLVCDGLTATGAWFCPKEELPLYREAWLRRVSPPEA